MQHGRTLSFTKQKRPLATVISSHLSHPRLLAALCGISLLLHVSASVASVSIISDAGSGISSGKLTVDACSKVLSFTIPDVACVPMTVVMLACTAAFFVFCMAWSWSQYCSGPSSTLSTSTCSSEQRLAGLLGILLGAQMMSVLPTVVIYVFAQVLGGELSVWFLVQLVGFVVQALACLVAFKLCIHGLRTFWSETVIALSGVLVLATTFACAIDLTHDVSAFRLFHSRCMSIDPVFATADAAYHVVSRPWTRSRDRPLDFCAIAEQLEVSIGADSARCLVQLLYRIFFVFYVIPCLQNLWERHDRQPFYQRKPGRVMFISAFTFALAVAIEPAIEGIYLRMVDTGDLTDFGPLGPRDEGFRMKAFTLPIAGGWLGFSESLAFGWMAVWLRRIRRKISKAAGNCWEEGDDQVQHPINIISRLRIDALDQSAEGTGTSRLLAGLVDSIDDGSRSLTDQTGSWSDKYLAKRCTQFELVVHDLQLYSRSAEVAVVWILVRTIVIQFFRLVLLSVEGYYSDKRFFEIGLHVLCTVLMALAGILALAEGAQMSRAVAQAKIKLRNILRRRVAHDISLGRYDVNNAAARLCDNLANMSPQEFTFTFFAASVTFSSLAIVFVITGAAISVLQSVRTLIY